MRGEVGKEELDSASKVDTSMSRIQPAFTSLSAGSGSLVSLGPIPKSVSMWKRMCDCMPYGSVSVAIVRDRDVTSLHLQPNNHPVFSFELCPDPF